MDRKFFKPVLASYGTVVQIVHRDVQTPGEIQWVNHVARPKKHAYPAAAAER